MNRASFKLATPADDGEIRTLLGAVPMEGSWRVGFAREPSFSACPAPAGILERALVAKRDGRILSVGSWSERDVWLGGTMERVGYLHGLRMATGTPASMRVLREGYAALVEHLADSAAVAWFTSIDAANTRARRVLESRANGLPRYTRLGEYRTRLLPVRQKRVGGSMQLAESTEELTEFFNRIGSRNNLALVWDEQRWADLASSGFTLRDVRVVRRHGKIVAAAGVWDQSEWKQLVLHGCPGWWQALRPVLSMAGGMFGWPRPPAPGTRVAMAHVFPFALEPERKGVLGELWPQLETAARSKEVEWLALGLDARDPLWQTDGSRRWGVDYHTILHQVTGKGFPEEPLAKEDFLFRPECATL